MIHRVITYNPKKICDFKTIKEAKNYMYDCGYNAKSIDKKTINCQITEGNIPQIRYEKIQILNN
jgi:hypothetical protein